MEKIEKLTAKQEQQMIEFREEWRQIGLATGPANIDEIGGHRSRPDKPCGPRGAPEGGDEGETGKARVSVFSHRMPSEGSPGRDSAKAARPRGEASARSEDAPARTGSHGPLNERGS